MDPDPDRPVAEKTIYNALLINSEIALGFPIVDTRLFPGPNRVMAIQGIFKKFPVP